MCSDCHKATHEIRLCSNALRISRMNKFTFKIAHGTDFEQKLADVRKKVVFIQILQAIIDLNSMKAQLMITYRLNPSLPPPIWCCANETNFYTVSAISPIWKLHLKGRS